MVVKKVEKIVTAQLLYNACTLLNLTEICATNNNKLKIHSRGMATWKKLTMAFEGLIEIETYPICVEGRQVLYNVCDNIACLYSIKWVGWATTKFLWMLMKDFIWWVSCDLVSVHLLRLIRLVAWVRVSILIVNWFIVDQPLQRLKLKTY